MVYDCVVVGAGPAGATAAYHLAKRGRSVLLLEKAALPRYKPCNGGVSPAVAQWFDFDLSPAIACKVDQIRYTWKLEDPIDAKIKTPEPMWMVQRDVFDHFLVQQAQKQGAELRDNTEVTGIQWQSDRWQVHTVNGPVEGRYLVAADGAKGPTRSWLGFKPAKSRTAAVLEISDTDLSSQQAQFEFGLMKNGFISNFPKPGGTSVSAATFRGGDAKNIQQTLEGYADQLGLNRSQSQFAVHPLVLWDGNHPLHTQNALLAGETAGIVDPLTAEGIRPSIFCGVKAAAAIDQAIAGNSNALADYTDTIHEHWGTDMVWAQRLAGVFYRIPGVGYRMGIKRPAATDRFSEILCGYLRYADIANFAIKKLSGSLIPGRGN